MKEPNKEQQGFEFRSFKCIANISLLKGMSSSDGYASRLSHYPNKGECGLPETIESLRNLKIKYSKLLCMIREAKYIVILTGAGISTSAGIPDFRGPQGIWTKEEIAKKQHRKRKASVSIDPQSTSSVTAPASFETAMPTLTHRAIAKLTEANVIQYTVTQNVDGLHMRSGLPRDKHCFLHGCLFTERCEKCGFEYFRDFDVGTINFQKTGRSCNRGRCKGNLRDTLLDWESPLPEKDWERAQEECQKSDLCLCLGTSLRIVPCSSLPQLAKKFVIINKQVTPFDSQAALCIRAPVDDVMAFICSELGVNY